MLDPGSDSLRLHVARLVPGVTTLGPGRRIALWVAGCSLRCPGCISPELFERRSVPAELVADVLRRILALAPDHTGLTVSGGEPFEQAGPLAALVEGLRRESALDVLVYSGFRRAELDHGSADQRRLLRSVDMLVDGRYVQGSPTRKLWRGSDNQMLHRLTPLAAAYGVALDREYLERRPLQVGFYEDGRLQIVGVPERGMDAGLRRALVSRGIRLRKRRLA